MLARSLKDRAPLGRSIVPVFTLVAVAAGVLVSGADVGATEVGSSSPVVRRMYGAAQPLGNGQARTYVVHKDGTGEPIELGVALSEAAMDNLPAKPAGSHENAHMGDHAAKDPMHALMTEVMLDLPANHGTQFTFVELNWNPAGHEPPGVYDMPHFDFHFWSASKAERDQIVPSNPQYAAHARNAPDAQHARAFFVNPAVAMNAPAEAVAVPKMGVHWFSAKSPELQGLMGNQAGFKPFTATYIQGAWNGKFIFEEPMITRAHIMSKRLASDSAGRDEIIPLPSALKPSPAGYYPSAYRITYDPASREYRIALTQLSYKE